MVNLDNIKAEFPTLIHNPELAYFDSAASAQTHSSVLSAMNNYYETERCNVHRGDYKISQSASDKIETAREQVAELINCSSEQIIFTAGATEGLNIVAEWYKSIDTVIVTSAEHSANILPWLAQGRTVTNGRLKVLPVNVDGTVDFEHANKIFEECKGSALLSIIATSNVTGIDTPWTTLAKIAKQHNIAVCIDACQTVGSHKLDCKIVDFDFAVFSAHKMFGPTGTGILFCRHDTAKLRPTKLGGGAVMHYDFDGRVEWVAGPAKHEPGTPNIAGIIGTGVAAEWINYVGYDSIKQKLSKIDSHLKGMGLFEIPGMIPINKQLHLDFASPVNVYSFMFDKLHPSDVGAILGNNNVAVRAGKLCAHPFVNSISSKGVLRISWNVYNTEEDCAHLVESLWKTIKKLT